MFRSKFFRDKQHFVPFLLLKHQNGRLLVIGTPLFSCNNEAIKQKPNQTQPKHKPNLTKGGQENEESYEVKNIQEGFQSR